MLNKKENGPEARKRLYFDGERSLLSTMEEVRSNRMELLESCEALLLNADESNIHEFRKIGENIRYLIEQILDNLTDEEQETGTCWKHLEEYLDDYTLDGHEQYLLDGYCSLGAVSTELEDYQVRNINNAFSSLRYLLEAIRKDIESQKGGMS